MLQLAERGQIHLDEDVNQSIHAFQLRPAQSQPVTTASLLTHTSGIENWFLGSLVRSPSDLVPLGAYFARRPPRTVRTPGTELTYSNQGMALAGYLVEVASGESFKDYAARHILKPLGMAHSSFEQTVGPAFEPYPAASLTSTAADMAQFLRMQLNNGTVDGQQILQPATVADMQRQHFTPHAGSPGVAYGFFESYWNGERILFHTGDSGDHSLLLLLPERGWGCYAVYRGVDQNADGDVREELTSALLNRYYPAAPFVLPKPASDPAGFEKFAGLYRASTVNPFTIEKILGMSKQVHIRAARDGHLEFRELGIRAVEVAPGLFRTDGGGYLSFRTASDGQIIGGTITGSIWDPQSFDRIAWWENGSLHRVILAICTLILFSRLLVGVVDFFRRRRKKDSSALRVEPQIALVGWRLSALLPFFVLAGMFCFLCNLLVWRPPITGVPPGGLALLVCITIASAIGLTLPAFAIFAWAKRAFGTVRRIYFSLLAAAGLLFAAVLFYWNVSVFRV